MIDHDRRDRAMAVALSALAGHVDATGYLATGGFFLSFMSGNSTRLGLGLGGGGEAALLAAGLIAAFVAGVTLGSLVARRAPHPRRLRLLLLAALLAVAALTGPGWPACLLTAAAMGAENTVFETDGAARISLTFMTGNLVKVGQGLAATLAGQPRPWLPWAGLWAAMVAGAVSGALLWPRLGWAGLWPAAALSLLLAAAGED